MNNLTDSNYIQFLLKKHSFKPNEILGQNFLIDEEALSDLVKAADLSWNDTVLEVGPGLGVLTTELVKNTKMVFAVEKDSRFISILQKSLMPERSASKVEGIKNKGNLEIFNQDILKFNLAEHIQGSYKVVANIPYYLTSKLIQNLLSASDRPSRDGEAERKPSLMILMLQKEVGERIVALPGELSILAISVQMFADAQIVKQVNKKSFWPQPKVDSVIIRIEPKKKHPEVKDHKLFFRIVKAAFAGKRKQIHNTLSSGLKIPPKEITQILSDAKISPTVRPQELSIEQWISLYERLFERDLKKIKF